MFLTASTPKRIILLTEPHRMFFALGTILSIVSIGWWVHYQYLLKTEAVYTLFTFAPGMHMVSLVYGMSTYFILGFILTVFPRWLSFPAFPIRQLQVMFFFFAAGMGVFFGGIYGGVSWFMAGSALNFVGFLLSWFILFNGFRTCQHPDKFQPRMALLGMSGGVLGSGAYFLYLWQMDPFFYRLSYGVGIFFYLSLLLYSVMYRMVPFFTKSVTPGYELIRYPQALQGWAVFSILKTILFVLQKPEWYWVADGGLLAVTAWQFNAWRFFMKKPVMLLKMLYISIAWFPIANVMFIAYSIYVWVAGTTNPILEEVALHALTIGCFASIILAMGTRVSLGHSGRKLQTNWYVNALFWSIQAACLTRVFSGLYSMLDPTFQIHNYHAGYFWLIGFGLWAVKFLPTYFVPRVDGK